MRAPMDMGNSRVLQPLPGVMLSCMTQEAREAMDVAVAAWERDHPGESSNNETPSHRSPYATLYWLFRWSGLFIVAKADETRGDASS